jgi:hypothetical protein
MSEKTPERPPQPTRDDLGKSIDRGGRPIYIPERKDDRSRGNPPNVVTNTLPPPPSKK